MTDEEELKQLRHMRAELTKDPEIRKEFQKVLKKAIPGALTPDLDQEEKINSRVADTEKVLRERLEKLEQEQLRAELSKKYEDQKARLSAPPWNFDEEDIAAVEKIIKEEEFPNYEAAAKYYKAQMEAQAPTRPSGLGLGGTSRSKTMRQQRREFNDRFKGVFKKPGNTQWQNTFDDAYEKVRSGQYLKE